MKSILKLSAFLLLPGLLFHISCKKKLACENCIGNKPPIARAGTDQTIILPKDSVTLDGSASIDPDGTITAYKWAKISGPVSANIIRPDSSKSIVKTLVQGVYKFELTVKDNGGFTVKDTMQVVVNNRIACAGADQVITFPINSVNLDGSCSTDPGNNITGYAWTKISGPSSFNIANANVVQTQVTNLVQGIYQFELKVTDAGGLFSKDTVQITVAASPLQNCDIANRPTSNASLTSSIQLPQPRYRVTVATAGDKIVIAGGYTSSTGGNATNFSDRVDIYDVTTGQWTMTQLSEPRVVGAVAVLGNKVFFGGGWNANGDRTTIDIYDISANTWSMAQLSLAREGFSGGAVDNKVIFAGGLVTTPAGGIYFDLNVSKAVDIYNAATNSWSTDSLSEARYGTFVTTVGHKFFVAAGQNCWNNDCPSNRIDIYDAVTNTWSYENYTPLNTGGYLGYLFSGIGAGNKNYWVTGDYWVGGSIAEIRDEITHTTTYECLSGLLYANPVKKDSKLIFLVSTPLTTQFDVYDLATNIWSISKLPPGLNSPSFISVNNDLYAIDGYSSGGGFLYDKINKLGL